MRNFEKIITKKKRRGYDEHVEFVNKQRKKRHRREMLHNINSRYGENQMQLPPFDKKKRRDCQNCMSPSRACRHDRARSGYDCQYDD